MVGDVTFGIGYQKYSLGPGEYRKYFGAFMAIRSFLEKISGNQSMGRRSNEEEAKEVKDDEGRRGEGIEGESTYIYGKVTKILTYCITVNARKLVSG